MNYCRKAYINIDQPDDIFCCLRETHFIVAEAISNGWLVDWKKTFIIFWQKAKIVGLDEKV